MQQIPVTGDARQTFRTRLGGQNVRLTVWWQPLDAHWYLAVAASDGARILGAARLVDDGRPMQGQTLDFDGEVFVDGIGTPERDAWTTGHRLVYATAAEVAALT